MGKKKIKQKAEIREEREGVVDHLSFRQGEGGPINLGTARFFQEWKKGPPTARDRPISKRMEIMAFKKVEGHYETYDTYPRSVEITYHNSGAVRSRINP